MADNFTSHRLDQIAAHVQDRLRLVAAQNKLPENDPEYRWQHTLRVARYGEQIARHEAANPEWVVAACLLHDLACFDAGERRDHGRLGAALSRPFLKSIGYSTQAVDNIAYSIASHVNVEDPVTLEARVVSDADNVDRFGAYRALMWCAPNLAEYPKMISVITTRLQRLEEHRLRGEVLFTPTGNALFNLQLELQIGFFKALIAESEITSLSGSFREVEIAVHS